MTRYKNDQRNQYQWMEGSLDSLLPEVSVARDIAAALERLDFASFEKGYSNEHAGSSAINPRSLVGIIMLGLLRGVTSSVQLAHRCAMDIEFQWIAGGVRVEKSTLCAFRKLHQDELVDLSCQVLDALGQHELLPAENMGVDGTIVRAASSRHACKKRNHLEKKNERLKEVVQEKLQEDGEDEVVNVLEKRRDRLEKALDEMTKRGLDKGEDKMTVSEPDAGNKRQKDGSFAPGFNAQVLSDLDSGVIIHADIIDAGNDCGQLQPQLEQAKEVLDEVFGEASRCGIETITADAAYHDIRQLDALESEGVECFVCEARKTNRKAPGVGEGYHAENFIYDEATDTMQCPEGESLARRKTNANDTATVYQAPTQSCAKCSAKGQCCPKTKGGRSVNRTHDCYQEVSDTVSARLKSDKGRRLKKARWVTCEGIFSRLVDLLHWRRNRMWGIEGARAELAWRTLTHNLLILAGVWKPITI